MARISAAEAERRFPITRMSVGRWIKAGLLSADQHGQVEEKDVLALIKRGSSKRDRKKQNESKTDSVSVEEIANLKAPNNSVTTGGHLRPGSDLILRDREVTIQNKQVKLARERIRYLNDVRKVIPVEIIARSFAIIGSALEEQFRMFAEREGDELFTLAADRTVVAEFKRSLAKKIDHAVRSVKVVVDRENLASMKERN